MIEPTKKEIAQYEIKTRDNVCRRLMKALFRSSTRKFVIGKPNHCPKCGAGLLVGGKWHHGEVLWCSRDHGIVYAGPFDNVYVETGIGVRMRDAKAIRVPLLYF